MKKLLIANRGEIAVRIMKTAKAMGLFTVAVYTEGEENLPHVEQADCAVSLGSGTLRETYLNHEKLIGIALQKGVDAIHPGYGFLSENAVFAAACRDAGIQFTGPGAEAIRLMGNKLEALKTVSEAGIPLLEQFTGDRETLLGFRDTLPYPVLVKAAAGGGGKGMRIVRQPHALEETLLATEREAAAYFGDGTVFIERYLEKPRHIEVQVLGDRHGNYIHLFERECSIQRRHQKIIEEAPSISLTPEKREEITQAALNIARQIGYYSAGTVEFLMDQQGRFYFLEMNTRIQVEHPATELITGIDIVREQIRVAEGQSLSIKQEDLQINGHAVEARIYAEKPEQDFMPSPGVLAAFDTPPMKGMRIDSGVKAGNEVRADFDPMIAKVIAHAANRNEAVKQLERFLRKSAIGGIHTNRAYLASVLSNAHFQQNALSTTFIADHATALLDASPKTPVVADKQFAAAAFLAHYTMAGAKEVNHGYWRLHNSLKLSVNEEAIDVRFQTYENHLWIALEDQSFTVKKVQWEGDLLYFTLHEERCRVKSYPAGNGGLLLFREGKELSVKRIKPASGKQAMEKAQGTQAALEAIKAPMFGKVLDIRVKEDSSVKAGDTMLILEAMKMENSIQASHDMLVKRINVQKGDQVKDGQVLIEVE